MKLVTIFTAFNPTEAEVIRSRLDVSGFHSVITHGLSALSTDGYSLATGGILVQVPEDEAEDARELLAAPDSDPPP
ncbi:MAG TPA: DUF2007 domain-containing protein [Verrucomicrobiae bacterium]|nr:DUF2007 domain-containing protein [Verrucomicrobiae bacterium]